MDQSIDKVKDLSSMVQRQGSIGIDSRGPRQKSRYTMERRLHNKENNSNGPPLYIGSIAATRAVLMVVHAFRAPDYRKFRCQSIERRLR